MPSTVIRRYSYDADSRRLLIVFQTGRTYAYTGVPPDVYAGMRAAYSRGQYFNTRIRDHYPFENLDDVPPESADLI